MAAGPALRALAPRSLALLLLWAAALPARVDGQPVEVRRISSDGAEVFAERHGGGPPVLVLHGFAAQWRPEQWRHLLAALEGRTVIGVDLRGHGRSGKPHDRGEYGQKLVGDVLAVMDAFGVPRADVIGYSLGGFVALEAARRHPERIRSTTLIGQGWTTPDELADMAAGAASLTRLDTTTLSPRDRESFRRNDVQALAALVASYPDLGADADHIAAIEPPMLAVLGRDDPRVERAQALRDALPTTRVHVLDGRDHGSILDDPAYAETIAAFLGEVSPSQASPAGHSAADAEALLDGLYGFLDAMHRQDADAMREALIPESRFTLIRAQPDGRLAPWVLTGEAFIEALTDPAITPLEERLGPPRVRLEGTLATVWADYQVFAGDRLSHCGTDAFQFALLDGRWKLLALADTPPRTECGTPFAPNPR